MAVLNPAVASTGSARALVVTSPWEASRTAGNNFDFFRLLFALFVVYSHCFQALGGTEWMRARDGFSRLSRGQLAAGELAVDGFFLISGFLITQSRFLTRGSAAFLIKRVLRIYPGFIVAALFCALVVGPLGASAPSGYWSHQAWKWFAFSTVTLQPPPLGGVFASLPMAGIVNGPMWTIRYEFWCYLGILGLGAVGLLRRRAFMLALLLGFWALYCCVPGDGRDPSAEPFFALGLLPRPWGGAWPRLITFFLAGACLYLYRDCVPRSRMLFLAALLLTAAGCVMGCALPLLLPAFGAYALFYLAFARRLPCQRVARHGDLSYGIYLYSWPVQQLFVLYLGRFLGPGAMLLLSLLVTLPLAWLSWKLVEEPCLKLKPRSSMPH